MGKKLQCSHLAVGVKADLEGKEGEIAILGMWVGCCVSPLPRRAVLLPHAAAGAQHGRGSPAEGMDAGAVAAVAPLAIQCA